jgi:hypothetical protein
MDTARTLANLERPWHGGEGPALQPCLATAPWAGPAVCEPRHAESQAPPAWAPGSPLMLEASAEEQAGTPHAGAARPSKGRRGQGAGGRVETCLPSATGGRWALVDGELCVPAAWGGGAWAQTRQVRGSPPERTCETTSAWGLQRVQRGQAQGGPCARVAGDAL